ncbi:MAG: MarR family transcriptional regulator [Marivirga sp.]|nr:MarR family transcriptional regulator [Marivirga sp.]
MKERHIQPIRSFNRFYTRILGLLDQYILSNHYNLPEARVLYELYHKEDLTASDLITLLKIDKGYLSRILLRFEKAKLIQKKRSPADGRSVHISLSTSGRKEFELLNEASNEQLRSLLAGLTEKECESLVQNMSEIKTILLKAQKYNG